MHDPSGIGSRTSTVSVRLSSLRTGWLIAVNGLLLHETETWLAVADLAVEAQHDLVRRRGEVLPVGRLALLELGVLGTDGRRTEQQGAEDGRQGGDDEPQRAAGNTGSGGHHRTTVVGRVATPR